MGELVQGEIAKRIIAELGVDGAIVLTFKGREMIGGSHGSSHVEHRVVASILDAIVENMGAIISDARRRL